MKKVYIVLIDQNISQPIGDEIDSIWSSQKKANERRDLLIMHYKYEEEKIVVQMREIW